MKATIQPLGTVLAAVLLLAVGGCAAPPPRPAPPEHVVRPTPPLPPPAVIPAPRWHDRLPVAGTWRWSVDQGKSTARFTGSDGRELAAIACDRASGAVIVMRAGESMVSLPATILTTNGAPRAVMTQTSVVPSRSVSVAIPSKDTILDAIVFSKGRFAIDVQGMDLLILPARPEIARVVEDCR